MKKTLIILCSVLMVILALVVVRNMFYRTTSYNNIKGSFNSKFGDQLNKQCEINLYENLNKVKFKYSNFTIEKGEIKISLNSSDGKELFKLVLKKEDKSEGKFEVSNLEGGKEYILLVNGSEVGGGRLSIEWEAEKMVRKL